MRLTPIGTFLRRYRISRQIILYDMARACGWGSAYLSGIETGDNPCPADLEERILSRYTMTAEEAERLHQAAEMTRQGIEILNW